MSDLEVYARQGFGRAVGLGRHPALIVVDFTNSFADPAQFGGGTVQAAVDATVPLLAAARNAGWPVVFTRVVYAADGADAGPFAMKVPALLTQTPDNPGTFIVRELAPSPGELVVSKTQPSAFFGTMVAPWLVGRGVDSVIVTGATTSGCVRATVVDAVSHGFRTTVAIDCVGDRALGPHAANLFDMGQKYADLLESSTIIELAAANVCRP